MEPLQVISIVAPPVAFLLGGLGALLVVRAPGVNPGVVVQKADVQTRGRSRVGLWVMLASLMIAPLRLIPNSAFIWISNLRIPGAVRQMPAMSLLITLGSSAGIVVVGYVVAWWFFQRIDWADVGLATGWYATFAQRLFLWLAFGLFLTWPITVPVQTVGVARFASEIPGAWVGQQWLGVAQSVIGHGLGLWAAGSILRQVAGRYDRFFKDASRLITLILLIALTSTLAQGVLQLFQQFSRILLPPPLNGSAGVRWIPSALPLLAYLLAIPVVRRIDWQTVEARSSWWPSALEEVLIYMTLSAWLAWPFGLPQIILTRILPAVLPAFVLTLRHVVVSAVALVVLYLVFLYSPGGERGTGAWEQGCEGEGRRQG